MLCLRTSCCPSRMLPPPVLATPQFSHHLVSDATNRALVTSSAQLGSRHLQCWQHPSFLFHLVSIAPNRALATPSAIFRAYFLLDHSPLLRSKKFNVVADKGCFSALGQCKKQLQNLGRNHSFFTRLSYTLNKMSLDSIVRSDVGQSRPPFYLPCSARSPNLRCE